MCRWAAYIGPEVFLEEVVTSPGRSLIVQSLEARECKTGTNGDGFGIAWYGDRPEPGLYRNVLPAWSDPNLRNIAHQVRSRLFLAHVRAAIGTATSHNNCHPFVAGRWTFMHNGKIGGHDRLRRRIDMMIPDALYDFRKGATDSEALFLLAIAGGSGGRSAGCLRAGRRSAGGAIACGRIDTAHSPERSAVRRRASVCHSLFLGCYCPNSLSPPFMRPRRPRNRVGAAGGGRVGVGGDSIGKLGTGQPRRCSN